MDSYSDANGTTANDVGRRSALDGTGIRKAVVVTHPGLASGSPVVAQTITALQQRGFDVRLIDKIDSIPVGKSTATVDPDTEIVVVLGGDGTILRAAELVKGTRVPVLGVNLGHVGFLAEFESFELHEAVKRIASRDYTIDERMIADVQIWQPHASEPLHDWALNDVVLEHTDRGSMIEVGIDVDGVAMSSFGCDGVIVSTPTGSTAYAFSAGGPVVWPGVEALELTPLAAHALFARPLIIGSDSTFGIEVLRSSADSSGAWICCDGRRQGMVPNGTRIVVHAAQERLRLGGLENVPFTRRLVSKFNLPVIGWREQGKRAAHNRWNEAGPKKPSCDEKILLAQSDAQAAPQSPTRESPSREPSASEPSVSESSALRDPSLKEPHA